MSYYATPVIVVNLGCEMIYVIHQRLKAQDIAPDKSEKVLTEITNVLLHAKLLDELFIPQPVGTHFVIKQLLQDIAATSIMKLDDYSSSKLWDLMTMIFKWQLSITTNQNIFDITRTHLNGVAMIMPQSFPKFVFEYARQKFDALAYRFLDEDYKCLHNTMILWFSEYHTKISVLMRLNLQRKDGAFNLPSTVNPQLLISLGENIYRYDNKKKCETVHEDNCPEPIEINNLLTTIDISNSKSNIELHLPINLGCSKTETKTIKFTNKIAFKNIDTEVRSANFNIHFTPNMPKSLNEDLFEMLGTD